MSRPHDILIAPMRVPDDLLEARSIFSEYMRSLDIDLSYQDADTELAQLPGKYAEPDGVVLLARDGAGQVVGCAALRPLGIEGACEIKRLYVRPAARGLDLGRRLAVEIIGRAKAEGYSAMYLDTLASMLAARRLYSGLGFYEIGPYYETPIAETIFMRLDLTR